MRDGIKAYHILWLPLSSSVDIYGMHSPHVGAV